MAIQNQIGVPKARVWNTFMPISCHTNETREQYTWFKKSNKSPIPNSFTSDIAQGLVNDVSPSSLSYKFDSSTRKMLF